MRIAAPRSLLYCSALKESQFCKAEDADLTVIDLEDGVAATRKDEARRIVAAFYSSAPPAATALRINSLRLPDGLRDILLLRELSYRPDVIVMAMVTCADEVRLARELLADFAAPIGIFVTVETTQCMRAIHDVAAAADGLIFGSADYAANLGVPIGGWTNILHARSQVVTAACCAGIPAFDTAFFKLGDTQGLADECVAVKDLGFVGKTAIHPNQVELINRFFTPSAAEIEQARAVVELAENSSSNITKLDKQMIGPPFVKLARKVLERHRSITHYGDRA
jgi:(S)-citramalyl-CoA lyase